MFTSFGGVSAEELPYLLPLMRLHSFFSFFFSFLKKNFIAFFLNFFIAFFFAFLFHCLLVSTACSFSSTTFHPSTTLVFFSFPLPIFIFFTSFSTSSLKTSLKTQLKIIVQTKSYFCEKKFESAFSVYFSLKFCLFYI